MEGGIGHDVLNGGVGNDQFYYGSFSHFGDLIEDFSSDAPGNDDRILIAYSMIDPQSVIDIDGSGAIVKACFQSSSSAVAANKSVRFIYDEDNGRLYYDLDGNKSQFRPLLLAEFADAPRLTALDFFVV